MKKKIFSFFSEGHERSKTAKKNIAISIIVKGLSIFAGFLLVPLALEYLDTIRYGIWLTLSSILAWFGFFDIGLGNGLRNKFAETKAKGNVDLLQAYVSTTYALVSIITITLFVLFLIVNKFLDWTKILNTPETVKTDLNNMVIVVFLFFCLRFVSKLITNLLFGDQKSGVVDAVKLLSKLLNLLLIFLLLKNTEGSLFKLSLVYSSTPVIVMSIVTIIFFSGKYSIYKPVLNKINFKYSKDLMKLGLEFFVIQISAIIIFTTDNMIITQLFGPAEVTPYSIAHKYFGLAMMGFTIIVAPFWSAFTEAYAKNDFKWIKTSIRNLVKIWIIIVIVIIIMLLFSNLFYRVWLNNKVLVPSLLSALMAFYVIMMTWSTIFIHFINGVGKIKLQRNVSIFTAIINIPLSIFFAKTMNLGLSGVILGSIVTLFVWVIIGPIQYNKIINNKAEGIWN